jgi:5-bromo-4-chloroindolyl phosphate hydrolysis protein
MIIASSLNGHTVWWVALGIGLVVIAVVIALMALLLSFILDIGDGVSSLLETGAQIKQQTSAVGQLATTHAALEQIKAEAVVHLNFLQGLVSK